MSLLLQLTHLDPTILPCTNQCTNEMLIFAIHRNESWAKRIQMYLNGTQDNVTTTLYKCPLRYERHHLNTLMQTKMNYKLIYSKWIMNSRINARYCQILGTVIEVSLCLDVWLRGQSPEWFAANRRDTMHIGNEFMQNTIMIIVEKSTIFPYILIDTADLSQRWINHRQVYWVSHTKMCANNNTFLILWFCICNEKN